MRRFEFPDGSLYDVIVSGSSNGGTRTEIEVTLSPAAGVPPHVHPAQEEHWTIVEGILDTLVGRDWRRVAAGETVVVPPGTVHAFRNRSAENVRFRSVHTPSLGFERYLERLYWLSAMNRIQRHRSLTSLLYSSLLLDAHRDDQRLANPGARAGVRTFASLARLLRMRVDR